MREKSLGKFVLKDATVVVSDPCYKKGTWCQAVLDNVKVGTWKALVKEKDKIIVELVAYHNDVKNTSYLDEKWEEQPFYIGVDSGQAGFFQESVYRNDNTSLDIPDYFGDEEKSYEGGRWYGACCSVTSRNNAGVIEGGVVSTSGYGDGCYTLYTVEKDDEIVAMKIVFVEVLNYD